MRPSDLSTRLRSIASAIDSLERPSRSLVASLIASLLLATDRTLGVTVRDAVMSEIVKAVSGEFSDGDFYDTNPGGKGFRGGYISFGIRPASWVADSIIGGILIQCEYDQKGFRSEEPETKSGGPEWKGHSKGGGLVELHVTACYYNKLLGGGCSGVDRDGEDGESGKESGIISADLGEIDILVDAREKVIDVHADSTKIARGLRYIINQVSSNPPAVAKSKEWRKKHETPTTSAKALLQYLVKNQRSDVGMSEIEALTRAQVARGVGLYDQLLEKNLDWFRSRGWPVNPFG